MTRCSLIAMVVAMAIIAAGCDGRSASGAAGDGPATSTSAAGGHDATACATGPLVHPPEPGWHRWPHAPCDCNIYVPDDLAAMDPPPREPCPFMPKGCSWITSPWAEANGGGYGKGMLDAAVIDGHIYLSLQRFGPYIWTDWLLLRDHNLIGMWRAKMSDPASRCNSPGVYIEPDGTGALGVVRADAETEPYVFMGPLASLLSMPARVEVFTPSPGLVGLPTGQVARSDRLLLLPEHYGGRFMVRDLETGTTYRPSPPLPGTMEDHFPIGNEVLFWIWEGARRTVWSWTPDSSRPLLMDDEYAYHGFVTDGHDAVWLRGMNQIGPNEFETLELWTSPLAGSPLALTDPKLLAVMPYSAAPYLAVGGGWAAATPTPYDVRVYRLDGGEERRVPAVRGLRWHLGLLGGGYLWLRGAPYPGSDLRYVARFDIDQLSVAQPP